MINDILHITLGVLLFVVWWFYFYFYKTYCIDLTRSELFSLRDKLFLLACEERLKFNSKEYGMTRVLINGMIRFLHCLSLSRLFLSCFFEKKHHPQGHYNFNKKYQNVINSLDRDTFRIISVIRIRIALIVIKHIARMLILPFVAYKIIYWALRASVNIRKMTKDLVEAFDSSRFFLAFKAGNRRRVFSIHLTVPATTVAVFVTQALLRQLLNTSKKEFIERGRDPG